MEVNVHHAKTNLSRLIEQAENGEEVIIARNGKPAVKLVPFAQSKRKSLLGAGIGRIWVSPDFDSPQTGKEIEELFYGDDSDIIAR